MAADKLVDSTQLDEDLTSVANAIRFKADISGALAFPSGFVTAIGNILPSVDVEPLSVTQNGTYTAPTGTAYSPVTVNVSGGGQPIEYEEGTYIPTEDVDRPTIYFANQHTLPPFLISFVHYSGTPITAINTAQAVNFVDVYQLLGVGMPYGSDSYRYAVAHWTWNGTGGIDFTNSATAQIKTRFDDPTESTFLDYRYWLSNAWFKPYASPSSTTKRNFVKDHTYKWKALWK